MNPRTLPLLALLVIAVGYTSLHRPLQAEKATLERQRANLTEQARADQHATALLVADLEAQLAGLEPRRASIEAALPRDLNPSDTLALIREAANRNHVTVNTTSIEDPQQDGDLKTIAISLAVDGTYDELLSFARDLENHTWPLTVDAINLETNQRGADPRLDARVSLQLHAYNPVPLDHFVTSEWDY